MEMGVVILKAIPKAYLYSAYDNDRLFCEIVICIPW